MGTKSQLKHSIKKKIATPWSWNCLIVTEYCKKARTRKMTIEKGKLQNKISQCCAITFQSILMAKKSPTKLRPLTLAPFSLAVTSSISLIIWANYSMFYVSKRQAILLLEKLFDSFSIEKNISLANTDLTIVKLKEISQLPCKRSCAE